ncbi:MAG: NADH-quinone oxidoreductase subunit G [Campylobacteraceae bacterium]|jgi:NADH-quinone oxidoreductase subunit G|nr:NADH-quinone oxidoreductase subunit G [Campylobacteraceae bacterium]
MSELVNITIDGKACKAKEGEFILNAARANDIFVPALCYVTRCSPTLACRVCLVEADGKQVYSCNAKVKEGMVVNTTTDNIEKERESIMEVYDVNHPLQCGVCDQSGECELQNYTLYMNLHKQDYAVRDVARPAQDWGVMKYDPGLCIVCEKCVTICKDMIGSNALSTVKRGADALDKGFKDTMPKDAYAMWNKLNKSLIGFDEDKCTDCGECIAVCPVGAIVSSDFQYKSNAWELKKIPAANPHSSDCSHMYYEIKHDCIDNSQEQKIYRVTNESHYSSLTGAARFGFDFENNISSKDEVLFNKAVDAFKNADTIKFSSYITNEEALILQKLKEKLGLKLVNNDALRYQNFMKDYSSTSGTSLYSGDIKDIHDSNFIISVGSMLKNDAPNVRYAFNNALTLNKGAGLYFHPVSDPVVDQFGKKGKTIETIATNPLSEESVLYFILDQFGKDLPADVTTYLESLRETRTKTVSETIKEKVTEIVKDEETGEEKEVSKIVPKKVSKDVEYVYTKLLDTIGSNEALLETIESMLAKKDKFALIVGEDLIENPNSENLAKLCGLIDRYTDFSVTIIPTRTNTLGVSLICDLDSQAGSNVVGYNKKASFQLSALGDGDLDMPALNQQEGTFTNANKRVVPTNAALDYNGYTLNDIANALGLENELTIDYTTMLPEANGFKSVSFDELDNHFGNDQQEYRGYLLSSTNVNTSDEVAQISEGTLEGTIIYKANPIDQFNEFTAKCSQLNHSTGYYASKEQLDALELVDGDIVEVSSNNQTIKLTVILDNQIAGKIGYVSTFEKDVPTCSLFNNYRFSTANIKKV